MTSNDNYRYEKVTMGVLMSDFVSDRNAPKADDVLPRFKLVDGKGMALLARGDFGEAGLQDVARLALLALDAPPQALSGKAT